MLYIMYQLRIGNDDLAQYIPRIIMHTNVILRMLP